MRKNLILVFYCILIVNTAFCSVTDTAITYFKNDKLGYVRKVNNLDSADFFRVILPPDEGEMLYNVNEFYANGTKKLIGKSDEHFTKPDLGLILLQGTCISYFPNGRKESIANYFNGFKDGLCTEYYPDGKLYCNIKYVYRSEPQYLDCYDTTGYAIAKDGNGRWIAHDVSSNNFIIQGNIKNGSPDGDWTGSIWLSEPITFIYTFKKGKFITGKGYDKNKKEYAFVKASEPASYKDGMFYFSGYVQRHIVLPKDSAGKKLKDPLWVTFIVEKDGHLDNFNVLGNPNPALAKAAIDVLKTSPSWNPRRFFGVPVQAKITFPINQDDFDGISSKGQYIHKLSYDETIPLLDKLPGSGQ